MNNKEYKEYAVNVKNFFKKEEINNLSRVQDCGENYFSKNQCDCCGTTLAGDRLKANGYNPKTKEIYEYEICTDCEYYVEYGQLDDQTMMDLEK